MRRTPTALLSLAVAAGLLAACGEDDTPDGAATTSVPEGPAGSDGAAHDGASAAAADARHIEVSAQSMAFDPDEIAVEAGEDIAIVLTSEDSLHDFTVDEFDGHIAAETGETGYGGFQAGEPGRYPFYCSVEGHREAGMEGVLVVEG